MKTLAQLITDVQTETDDDQLPKAWVIGWLNEALSDLTPVLLLEATAVIPVVAGVAEYAEPADLHGLRLLKLAGEPKARQSLPLTDFASIGYKLWDDKITLQPAPTKADTINLWYHRRPVALVNDGSVPGVPADVPEVPEEFQHILTWYACAAYQAQQNATPIEMTAYWQTYLLGKAALGRYVAKRQVKQAPKQWAVQR